MTEELRSQLEDFRKRGFATIEHDLRDQAWLDKARQAAVMHTANAAFEDGRLDWSGLHIGFPPSLGLRTLLSCLLQGPLDLPTGAQLSTLVAGCRSDVKGAPHVDGAPEVLDTPNKVYWHALLVGVLLVDLDGLEKGNPRLWPDSLPTTRRKLGGLSNEPTAEEVREAILECPTTGIGEPTHIRGQAGTIFVVDHEMVHGMADHTTPDFVRHVAYFRVPATAFDLRYVGRREHYFNPDFVSRR